MTHWSTKWRREENKKKRLKWIANKATPRATLGNAEIIWSLFLICTQRMLRAWKNNDRFSTFFSLSTSNISLAFEPLYHSVCVHCTPCWTQIGAKCVTLCDWCRTNQPQFQSIRINVKFKSLFQILSHLSTQPSEEWKKGKKWRKWMSLPWLWNVYYWWSIFGRARLINWYKRIDNNVNKSMLPLCQ